MFYVWLLLFGLAIFGAFDLWNTLKAHKIKGGHVDSNFLNDLQDYSTKNGFWNLFHAKWGEAQQLPNFKVNFEKWLSLSILIQKLEEKDYSTREEFLVLFNSMYEEYKGYFGFNSKEWNALKEYVDKL